MKNANLILAVCMISSVSYAETYDDCVLNAMKGVSSDAAARIIAQSCRNKIGEAKKAKADTFGPPFSEDEYSFITGKGSVSTHDDGFVSQLLKNKSSYKTITYLALIIKDGDYYSYKNTGDVMIDFEGKINWQLDRRKTYFYKLSVKPNSEIRVLFRKPKTDSFYSEVQTIRGRESKWSDSVSSLSVSSLAKPEPKDPLE